MNFFHATIVFWVPFEVAIHPLLEMEAFSCLESSKHFKKQSRALMGVIIQTVTEIVLQ